MAGRSGRRSQDEAGPPEANLAPEPLQRFCNGVPEIPGRARQQPNPQLTDNAISGHPRKPCQVLSGSSSRKGVEVQVLSSAPDKIINLTATIGNDWPPFLCFGLYLRPLWWPGQRATATDPFRRVSQGLFRVSEMHLPARLRYPAARIAGLRTRWALPIFRCTRTSIRLFVA